MVIAITDFNFEMRQAHLTKCCSEACYRGLAELGPLGGRTEEPRPRCTRARSSIDSTVLVLVG